MDMSGITSANPPKPCWACNHSAGLLNIEIMPPTPLENLIAKALRARATASRLFLSVEEAADLCVILEKYVSALANRGRKPIGERAMTNAERQARKYAKRKLKAPN